MTFIGDYIGLDYGRDGKANLAWTDMRLFRTIEDVSGYAPVHLLRTALTPTTCEGAAPCAAHSGLFGFPSLDGIADGVISRRGSGHGFITVWTVSVD